MSDKNPLDSRDLDKIRILTINRPKSLNALNALTIEVLHDAVREAEKAENIRVIILTGSGDKAFVAGADIKEFSDFKAAQGAELARKGQQILFDTIEDLHKPVIAAINGFALGGGLELAMACHMRVAAEHAQLGMPETALGLIPGYGGTQRLPQLVGRGKAMEMILTGASVSAQQAAIWGLVNYTTTGKNLLKKCEEIAAELIKNAPQAQAAAIHAIHAGFYREGFKTEIRAFGECFDTDDFKEGTQAFLERRKPAF
ncbi:MAG: enoyl-CoA hydratase-related protein [Flavobacteriales bacterium]